MRAVATSSCCCWVWRVGCWGVCVGQSSRQQGKGDRPTTPPLPKHDPPHTHTQNPPHIPIPIHIPTSFWSCAALLADRGRGGRPPIPPLELKGDGTGLEMELELLLRLVGSSEAVLGGTSGPDCQEKGLGWEGRPAKAGGKRSCLVVVVGFCFVLGG